MPLIGFLLGIGLAASLTLLFGVYTIGPTQRGVLTTFGRAQRTTGNTADDPQLGTLLNDEEKLRYNYPNIRVIQPGGPYFKWPWQGLSKIDMTIQTMDITWDPDVRQESIEAVTKDNLTVHISGQIRWKPCERNLYAYLFGISHPAAHVVGYFISVLRDRIATFHGENNEGAVEGVSINDLRRNLTLINSFMETRAARPPPATA
jgi:regulator of protease activity HflC (stomatin/prohibitin superfamily)